VSEFKPKVGNYATLQTPGWTSFFIQLGTDCKDTHVIGYAGVLNGIEMVLEAKPSKGVCLSPLSNYKDCVLHWNKHEDFTDEEGIAAFNFGMQYLEDKYSWGAIFLNALRILHVTNSKFLSNRMLKSVHFICSSFWAVNYASIGRPISDKPAWQITPADFTYRTLDQ
jgi:hypothetical protein